VLKRAGVLRLVRDLWRGRLVLLGDDTALIKLGEFAAGEDQEQRCGAQARGGRTAGGAGRSGPPAGMASGTGPSHQGHHRDHRAEGATGAVGGRQEVDARRAGGAGRGGGQEDHPAGQVVCGGPSGPGPSGPGQ